MDIGSLFLVLLLLACPLLMVFMHRGSHRAHGGRDHSHVAGGMPSGRSLEELRRHRDAIDCEIARIESEESKTEAETTSPTPT